MKQKQQGDKIDPFWELPEDRRKVVMTVSRLNAQDPSNATAKNMSESNDEWMRQYYSDRSKYFDSINAQKKAKDPKYSPPEEIAINGLTNPKASTELQNKLNELEKITDPAQRRQFYDNNPDIIKFFESKDQYNRAKRDFLGLPQYDKRPKRSPKVEQLMDQYYNLPKNDGPRGGNKSRSLFLKSHPEIIAQWTVEGIFDLQNEATKSSFENTELTQKAMKDIKSLGRNIVQNADGSYSFGLDGSGGYGGYGKKGKKGGKGKKPTIPKAALSAAITVPKVGKVRKSNIKAKTVAARNFKKPRKAIPQVGKTPTKLVVRRTQNA